MEEKVLGLKNEFAKEQCKEGFQRWPKSLTKCLKRQSLFTELQKKATPELLPEFNTLQEHTKKLEPLLRESSATESESYSQVCFRGSPWSGLNSIPFALIALSIYKSYIVPAFSVILPLLTWILPYILLRSFFNINIKFSDYTSILWRMWNGHPLPRTPQEMLDPPPMPPKDMITTLKSYVQNGWTLFTLGQTMYQPIQQARHFQTLDKDCLDLGNSIIGVKEIAERLLNKFKNFLPKWFSSWIEKCPSWNRQAFAFVIDNNFWLPHTLRALGRFEVLFKLALRSDVKPVQFVKSDTPILLLKGFGDPSISEKERILSSVCLKNGSNHAIVTGPNRGGKSSFMRGVLMNIQLAHAFGCCFAEKAQMTPFAWIADGMRLDDKPGKESMFEREVGFAAGVLAKASCGGEKQKGFGFVLYDELFHSTNPPDGKRTSELFCNKLWESKECLSLVSTHVYSLAENAPSQVQKLCLASWKKENKYKFSYKVKKGICEVSSVDLLLKQFGLL